MKNRIEETDQLDILKAAVEIITEKIRANLLNFRYNTKDLERLDDIVSRITSTMRLTHNYIQYHLMYIDSEPRELLAELVRYNNIKLPMAEKKERIENLIMSDDELADLELNAVDFEKEYAEYAAKASAPVELDMENETKSTRKRTKRS